MRKKNRYIIFLVFSSGWKCEKKIYLMRRNIFLKVLQCVKLKKNEKINFHKFIWGVLEKKKKDEYNFWDIF